MKDFFKQISEIMQNNGEVVMVIHKMSETELTVSVNYRNENVKDQAIKHIQPFCVTGTPEEMDQELLELIEQPIIKSAQLQTNMEDYEAAMEVAKAKSKAETEKKKEELDKEKNRKATLKKATDKAEAAKQEGNWDEAVKQYKEALKSADAAETIKIKKEITACEIERSNISLFGDDNEEEMFMNQDLEKEINQEAELLLQMEQNDLAEYENGDPEDSDED